MRTPPSSKPNGRATLDDRPEDAPVLTSRPVQPASRGAGGRLRDFSLLRNSGYNMGTTIVSSLFGYFYWVLAARRYDAAEVGLAASLIAALTIASAASSIGLGATIVQALPRRPTVKAWSATLNGSMLVGAALGVPGAIAVVVGLPLASSSFDILIRDPLVALLLVVGVVTSNAASVLDSAFIAERASGYSLFRNLVFAVVKLPLVVLPFVVALGAAGILGTWVVAVLVGLAPGFWLIVHMKPAYTPSVARFATEARTALGSLAG